MKNLLLVLAIFLVNQTNAQEAYFSNSSFELGVKPDQSECKKQFSDNETIYGLIYFDESFEELEITSTQQAVAADGKKYKFKLIDINYQFGNTPITMISKRAYSQVMCEYEGKSYLMLTITPDAKDCYFMSQFPECMGSMYSSGLMSNSFNMVIKSFDYPKYKFSAKIKMKRTRSSEEGKTFFKELKTACYDNPKNFQKDFHNANDIADAEELTFAEVKINFEGDLAPGTSFGFGLETKKAGEEFKDGRYAWPGFEFKCEGCQIVDGIFVVNPLPFGAKGTETITVTATNLHNPACNSAFTQKLTYAGDYTFNYSGGSGAKGRSEQYKGYNGGNGRDAYALDVFITSYKEQFILVKMVHAKDNSVKSYLFKKDDSKLIILNRGGKGGTGGMATNAKGGVNARGGNGGSGGAVTIHIDPSVKAYADKITVDNGGGAGGSYVSGNGGSAGQAGQSGAAPKFIHEKVTIEMPN